MRNLLNIFSIFLAFSVCVSCGEKVSTDEDPVSPQEKPTEKPSEKPSEPSLNILFIGNSFTMDAVTHLPGMLDAAGIKGVHMIHMYYGGRLVQQYNSGWKTSSDYQAYECEPGKKTWAVTTGKTLEQVASSRKWDIVTIQEHTGSKFAWTWDATERAHFKQLVKKIKATQTKSPKIYYILSQAYQDNAQIGSGSTSSITWTDHKGMWDVISAFGQKVMTDVEFDGIISTGAMLENLRTTSLNNDMGLTRDGYHMDNGIARYGASCVVFETLISPVYDIHLDDNSFRFNESGPGTTPVTDENASIALEAAVNAIESPYTITDMSSR